MVEATIEVPVAEATVNGAATGDAAGSKVKRGRRKREAGEAPVARTGIYFQAPDALRTKIDAEAAEAGKTPAVWVRDYLAGVWGLTLPPVRTRHTYGSDEERKAALKASRDTRADLIKLALAEYAKTHPEAFGS